MQTSYSAQRLVVAENPGEGTGAICFAHPLPASLLSEKYIILPLENRYHYSISLTRNY